MEWVMSSGFSKVLGAGLLTLAVVGGAAAYLTSTLNATQAKVAFDGITTEQSQQSYQTPRHAEVIVTEGQAS
jgi:hypothetical protein